MTQSIKGKFGGGRSGGKTLAAVRDLVATHGASFEIRPLFGPPDPITAMLEDMRRETIEAFAQKTEKVTATEMLSMPQKVREMRAELERINLMIVRQAVALGPRHVLIVRPCDTDPENESPAANPPEAGR